MQNKIRRALISVSDKAGIVEFAGELHKFGVEILSTGGTAKQLRDNKIPVTDVSDFTGSPEILDGRLKTLHPKIHGGILGIRKNEKHKKEMAENGILPIDMVVVNLYPFEATIAKKDCSLEIAIENIDIGGPAMIRAAAKNWEDVAVVTDSNDYRAIIEEMKLSGQKLSKETLFNLAKKVFAMTARYESAINNYLENVVPTFRSGSIEPDLKVGTTVAFPDTLTLTFNKVQDLRYGENPHQKAAFYKDPSQTFGISGAAQLHGKELSYNNIMDADSALVLATEFAHTNAAVIIKHTNPCGVATSEISIAEAFLKARDCDPISAFGGIVALTRPVNEETAKAIGDTFFEVIIAPKFEDAALKVLTAKKNLRLLAINVAPTGRNGDHSLRKVSGGLLVQDIDTAVTDVSKCKVVTKRRPSDEELNAMDFAWRVVKHVKSNAIVISSCDRIFGVGVGQTSRIDSVKIAIEKMNDVVPTFRSGGLDAPDLKVGTTKSGRVLASDAFFPFRDGIDLAAKAGVTAIVQPGGSIKDEDVIKAANEHNLAMIFTGIRHFHH